MKTTMRRFTVATAAWLALVPAIAQAAEPPCLTAREFTALAEFGLPSVINGVSQRCATTLGASAFLPRSGAELAARYGQRRPAAWPTAKAAFLKLSGATNADAGNLLRSMPDASLQQMLDSLMSGMASQQVPLDRCATIDRLIALLSPLPAANTAEAIALAVGLGARTGQARLGALSICKA
jgi:hypothetical protein